MRHALPRTEQGHLRFVRSSSAPLPPELVSPSLVRVPAFDRYHLVQLPLDEDLQQANLAPGPGRQPLRIEAQGQPVQPRDRARGRKTRPRRMQAEGRA